MKVTEKQINEEIRTIVRKLAVHHKWEEAAKAAMWLEVDG